MCALGRHTSDRNELFVELLTLHQRTLYGFIYTLVPNAADAEDLLQQTSLVLWQKFDKFDLGSSFSAWACQIAHFTVLDHLKKKRRSHIVFDDELVARLAETRHNREAVHLSDRTLLAECVEKLSEGDRKLIKLCYAAKRNIKAAAAALDRPVTSVYMSLVRIRRLLMDCIRRTNVEEGN
jgi:RNA polymerase sigma-70 factor (ECF subfamily)